jgi:hypothetical protein
VREAISAWWTVDGGAARDLIVRTGIGHGGALLFGGVWLVAAVVLGAAPEGAGLGLGRGHRRRPGHRRGLVVHLRVSSQAFEPHPIQALSFTGPSAEVLTRVLFVSDKPPTSTWG